MLALVAQLLARLPITVLCILLLALPLDVSAESSSFFRRLQSAASSFTLDGSSVTLSYGWLGNEKSDFCRQVPTPPPQLDETSDYPMTEPVLQESNDWRIYVQNYRANQVMPLMQSCPIVGATPAEDSACSGELSTYASGMILFTTPVLSAVLFLLIWWACCWVALCRCCRRCCLCAERKTKRDARTWQKALVIFLSFICTVAVFACALAAYTMSTQISGGISDMLCQMLTMSDETLNGSEDNPVFLGVDEGIQRIKMLRRFLDVDGQAMTDVRGILDDTADFSSAMDDLLKKISHMQRVLSIVGQHKMKEHSCWFCARAVGNNATGEVGLLNELIREIESSSADAMRQIQLSASSTLTGRPLVDVSSAVRRGGLALEVFKAGFVGVFVDGFLGQRRLMQTIEDARHTIFRVMVAFCIVHALIVSNLAVYHGKRSKEKYPSATPSCVAWFCGFCALTFALLFTGLLVIIAVPLSEICGFTRYDLLNTQGVNDYYRQMGLYDPTDARMQVDDLAVEVFRTCLTPEGSGGILEALQLEEKLRFQEVLDDRFEELEDKLAGRVVDNAKFQLLVTQAMSFGGLFYLDPDEPKPLDPSAASKIIGSSLDPDDKEGPDGESLIYGLNTFAELIAGPGRYSFAHGTAGGGTLITATSPSEADVADEPRQMQHALIYARLKEQILSESGIFRCDVMDSHYQVTERFCSLEEYRQAVIDMSLEVREAGDTLGLEAQKAKRFIAVDLKDSLQGVLLEVRRLRTLFRCRFLWRRWEDFDFALCNVALPGMLQGAASWMVMAIFTFLVLVQHYKIWRHLLDNKIVGEELERFAKKYEYLSIKNGRT